MTKLHPDEWQMCVMCDQPAQWIRHTQFAGNHPYCEQHALLEPDFLLEDTDTFWTKEQPK